MVEYLAEHLEVKDASCVKQYIERPKTAYEHAWEIRDAYGYPPSMSTSGAGSSVRSCTGGPGRMRRSRRRCSTKRPGWLRRNRVLLPGVSVLGPAGGGGARSRTSGCTRRWPRPPAADPALPGAWWRCWKCRRGGGRRSWSGCADRRRGRRAPGWGRPWSGSTCLVVGGQDRLDAFPQLLAPV
ncbi:DUF4158 domain-containing protein [Streptomyces smyrnaeus]|uniref:DUF4158 domain-containing protein n=1 Tax=Streptomyces smyrnaeus TaxID=1387713 RepID=UPI0033ED4597